MYPAAFFVMAILGCADDGVDCRQVGVAPTRFISAAACNIATRAELERQTDQPYPVIMAQCAPAPMVQVASAGK